VKIMTDYGIQVSLREGCKKILVGDCIALLQSLYALRRQGMYIEEFSCAVCKTQISIDGKTFSLYITMQYD
jgi:vacuolar protein sorting-associated protein 41